MSSEQPTSSLETPLIADQSTERQEPQEDPFAPTKRRRLLNLGIAAFLRRSWKSAGVVHFTVASAIAAIIVGAIVNACIPGNRTAPAVALTWLGLPGELFLRAITAAVLPLVSSLIILGAASIVRSSATASTDTPLQPPMPATAATAAAPAVSPEPAAESSQYVAPAASSSASLQSTELATLSPGDEAYKPELEKQRKAKVRRRAQKLVGKTLLIYLFTTVMAVVEGIAIGQLLTLAYATDGPAVSSNESGSVANTDISTMLINLLKQVVPNNIVASASAGNMFSIIVCMFLFGVCIPSSCTKLLSVVEEVGTTMTIILRYIVYTTPVAVFSLVLKQVLLNPDLLRMAKLAAVLLGSVLMGCAFHLFVTLPLVYLVLNRANPFSLLRRVVPVLVTAFATASSAATLPTAIRVTEEIGISREAINFVLPLGASISMDGTALHLAATLTFLAYSQGAFFQIEHFFSLGISTVLLALGGSPIPSASLSLIVILWNSVFPGMAPPVNLGYVFALDWLLDRFRTPVNVAIDLFVVAITSYRLTGKKPPFK